MTTHTHYVKSLIRSIEGAKTRGDAFPHLLLTGPAGVGKTHLALTCGLAYGTRVRFLTANRSMTLAGFAEQLRAVVTNDVIFWDEAHSLRCELQEALFALIDFGDIPHAEEGKVGRKSLIIGNRNVQKVSLILATNQPGSLVHALVSRLRYVYLPPLSVDELMEIGREYAIELTINVSPRPTAWSPR